MKHTLTLFFILLFATFSLHAQLFEAHLSGYNEVQPIASRASGSITAVLSGDQLIVQGAFYGIHSDVDTSILGGAHLHLGYAGQNGPVQFPLVIDFDGDLTSGSFATINNTFTLNSDQIDALMERRIYVNIHSMAYGGGELRGQLLLEADEYYAASLFGGNEVPAIISSGSGALNLEVNGNTLVVSGSFANMDGDFDANIGGGAHLHIGNVSANGGVAILLNATVDADLKGGVFEAANNTFTLDANQQLALLERNMYANIHTTSYQGGELRGQITGQANAVFRAHLSGSNEMPTVTSQAQGRIMAELSEDSVLTLYGGYSGLESPLATSVAGGVHLHNALAGSNGSVEVLVNTTGDATMQEGIFESQINTYTLTEAQIEALFARSLYLNIHSEGNMAGELRGQLLPVCQAVFTTYISSIFTVPQVTSTAMGAAKAELAGDRLTISGSFDGLGSDLNVALAGGAHVHSGMAGATGGISIGLNTSVNSDARGGVWLADSNTYSLDLEQQTTLKSRGNYINIHSMDFGSGEIRGQVLAEATTYFVAPLSAANQTPSINSPSAGMAILEVNDDAGILSGSFFDLLSPFNPNIAGGAHIHNGLDGQAGGIAIGLNATVEAGANTGVFEARNNLYLLSSGMIDTLRMRMNYLNIHTELNGGGELRGQFLPLATAYFTSTLSALNEVQPVVSDGIGSLKLELNGNFLTLSGSFDNLLGDFDPNVAGGAHLHMNAPGANGMIALGITPTLDADLKGGVYLSSDNLFELNEDQMGALLDGNLYANIHSTIFGGGEIRGQVLPEINFFPSDEAEIVGPPNGATLLIEGSSSNAFNVTWDPASDETQLAYIWQLSTTADFNNIIVSQNVGSETTFSTDFGTIDGILAGLGILIGATPTVYHRVVSSDGSLNTASEGASVILIRGIVTGIEEILAEQFKMELFPNLVSSGQSPTLSISAKRKAQAQLQVFNPVGQNLYNEQIELQAGEQTYNLAMPQLSPGIYFVNLKIDNRLLPAQRLIVK